MYQPVFGQKTTIEYSLLCLKGNSIYTKFAEMPIGTTMNIYGHLNLDHKRKLGSTLNGLFDKKAQ